MASKGELLDWLNNTLRTDYHKLELCKDGNSYCRILEILHPQQAGMAHGKHVRDPAKKNFDHIDNILRQMDVKIKFDYQALAAGSFREHLKFCRWLRTHFLSSNENIPASPPQIFDPYQRPYVISPDNASLIQVSCKEVNDKCSVLLDSYALRIKDPNERTNVKKVLKFLKADLNRSQMERERSEDILRELKKTRDDLIFALSNMERKSDVELPEFNIEPSMDVTTQILSAIFNTQF